MESGASDPGNPGSLALVEGQLLNRSMTVNTLSFFFVVATIIAQGTQQKPQTEPQSKSAAAPIPSVNQILDKYVQAVGGKAAIERQRPESWAAH